LLEDRLATSEKREPVNALARETGGPAVAELLERLSESDPSLKVRQAAMRAIAARGAN
jgi:hypothetical protein